VWVHMAHAIMKTTGLIKQHSMTFSMTFKTYLDEKGSTFCLFHRCNILPKLKSMIINMSKNLCKFIYLLKV